MNTTQEQLDALFPTPSPPLGGIAPTRWPGYDSESTRTLLELLKDNHKRWHIFFNDMGFHKSVGFSFFKFVLTDFRNAIIMVAMLLIICCRSTLWVPIVLHFAPRTRSMQRPSSLYSDLPALSKNPIGRTILAMSSKSHISFFQEKR